MSKEMSLCKLSNFGSILVALSLLLGGCATPVPCTNLRVMPWSGGGGVTFAAMADDLIYPLESCLAGREGVVVARFEQLQNGLVENVRIRKSSGDPLMDQEVVRALE